MRYQNYRLRHTIVMLLCMLASTIMVPASTQAAGVVGTGTPASCSAAVLAAAVQGGGLVTFNCGSSPHTIVVAATLEVTAANTTIDGAGLITLSGAGQRRIIRQRSLSSSSTLTLRNLTIANGFVQAAGKDANGAGVQSIFQGADPAFKPALVLDTVTFQNNRSVQTGTTGNAYDFGGGAVYSQGGSVTVTNSTFTNNHADNGGGGAIHILQSGLAISNTSFTSNSAIGAVPQNSQGGAIYIDGLGGAAGEFVVRDSQFGGNTSYNSGGAIYLNMYENSTRALIERSSFTNNAIIGGTGALGGAISGGGTSAGANTGNPVIVIRASTFSNNRVRKSAAPFDGSGGALAFAQRAVITIENSTFSANQAEGSTSNANGGAVYVVNNTIPFSINNSTFANNSAGWVGGAISNSEISNAPGGSVRNTIFWNNSAANGGNSWNIQQHCSSELSDAGNNLQYPPRNTNQFTFNEVSCLAGKSAINQRSLPDFRDAQLLPLGDTGGPTFTHGLAYTSPALNAANLATCLSSDQRGVVRNGICDIGAHEFGSLPYVAALQPAFVEVGSSSLVLTVIGADFDPGSAILWDTVAQTTQFLNSGALATQIGAANLVSVGEIAVGVRNNALAVAPTSRQFAILANVYDVRLPMIMRMSSQD